LLSTSGVVTRILCRYNNYNYKVRSVCNLVRIITHNSNSSVIIFQVHTSGSLCGAYLFIFLCTHVRILLSEYWIGSLRTSRISRISWNFGGKWAVGVKNLTMVTKSPRPYRIIFLEEDRRRYKQVDISLNYIELQLLC